MATLEGAGEIKPAPLTSQPSLSPMVRSDSHPSRPLHTQEHGEDDTAVSNVCLNLEDYYDVMILGYTGMGKSTTSDKIIIAKLVEAVSQEDDENELKVEGHKLTIEDFTFWNATGRFHRACAIVPEDS